MTPPPPSSNTLTRRSAKLAEEDLRRIRWAGWSILSVMVLSWAGWLSLLTIAHTSEIALVTERENLHYKQLRDDIARLTELVKEALKR